MNPSSLPDTSTSINPFQRLVSMRWLSAILMLAVGLGATPVFGIGVPTKAILVISVALGAWNVVTQWHPPGSTQAALMEFLVDLAAWASFLYLTGGATNPMASLLLPLVAVGATLLPQAQAWLLAGISVSIYVSLWFVRLPLSLPHPDQAAMWHLIGMEATFAVSAAVVVWYVSRLSSAVRQRDRTLSQAREQALRNERILALANQAASATHELGTPLGSMRLLVTEMLRSTQDSATREDLLLIDNQIEQCKRILSRLTEAAGRARASEHTTQAFSDWLDQQIATVTAQRPEARIVLASSPPDVRLAADAALDHALHNILTNALKAAPGAAIDVETRLRGSVVDIRVLDNGPGMPAELLSMTAHATEAPLASEGLGIGLLLTQAAVEARGGSLSYERRPEGGTIATITLPIVTP